METPAERWGKLSLVLAKVILMLGVVPGYLVLCWWYEPVWWLAVAGFWVAQRVKQELAEVFLEQELQKVERDGRLVREQRGS